MVGYWSYMSSHDVKSSMVVDFNGLYIIDFIGLLSYPSEAFQLGFLVLTLVFPKLGLCHPNKGCSFLLL